MNKDISPDFIFNEYDAKIGMELIKLEGTPECVVYFNRVKKHLTNYGYWFFLSVIWVKYTGYSNLKLWKNLFALKRPQRETSIMKPSELVLFKKMPDPVLCYRTHRPNEEDWISYTLDINTAIRFAVHRKVDEIKKYIIPKKDIIALFLRRGEYEIICIDKQKAQYIETIRLQIDKGDKQCLT